MVAKSILSKPTFRIQLLNIGISLISIAGFAQNISVSVNKNHVAVGEQFTITYSLNGDVTGFTAPSFNGFKGSGPSTSYQTMISGNK